MCERLKLYAFKRNCCLARWLLQSTNLRSSHRMRRRTYRELGVQHAEQLAVLNALAASDANRGLFSARKWPEGAMESGEGARVVVGAQRPSTEGATHT